MILGAGAGRVEAGMIFAAPSLERAVIATGAAVKTESMPPRTGRGSA
jgi:hypothetical protein